MNSTNTRQPAVRLQAKKSHINPSSNNLDRFTRNNLILSDVRAHTFKIKNVRPKLKNTRACLNIFNTPRCLPQLYHSHNSDYERGNEAEEKLKEKNQRVEDRVLNKKNIELLDYMIEILRTTNREQPNSVRLSSCKKDSDFINQFEDIGTPSTSKHSKRPFLDPKISHFYNYKHSHSRRFSTEGNPQAKYPHNQRFSLSKHRSEHDIQLATFLNISKTPKVPKKSYL